MRLLATIAAALALVVTTLTPAQAAASDTYESQVLTYTNTVRKSDGKVAVKHRSCLDGYSESWAKYIASKRKLIHRSSSSLMKVMKACKLNYINENLAAGYGSGKSVVLDGWMHSPGHKKNLLDSRGRVHGVGAVYAGGRWWVVQNIGRPS